MDITDETRCPCGTGETYGACCAQLHRGARPATAEALMRSRFSAFALGDAGYLRHSWHPRTRPREVDLDDGLRWTRLDVLRTSGGGPFDNEGTVEFRAHYRDRGTPGSLHENSQFTRIDGRWVYFGPVGQG